jgi:hypothetical protein
MAIYLIPRPALEFSVLAVGIALCRIHGPYYARCFLEDHGVDKDVITELLALPGRQHPVEDLNTDDGNSF